MAPIGRGLLAGCPKLSPNIGLPLTKDWRVWPRAVCGRRSNRSETEQAHGCDTGEHHESAMRDGQPDHEPERLRPACSGGPHRPSCRRLPVITKRVPVSSASRGQPSEAEAQALEQGDQRHAMDRRNWFRRHHRRFDAVVCAYLRTALVEPTARFRPQGRSWREADGK